MEGRRRKNRGQLLLVGAITIAFIILGVVVLVNSTMYTETISSGETSSDTSNLEVVDAEINSSIQELLNQSDSDTDLETMENRTMAWGEGYSATKAEQGHIFVHIEDVEYYPEDIDEEDYPTTYLYEIDAMEVKYSYVTDTVSATSTINISSEDVEID